MASSLGGARPPGSLSSSVGSSRPRFPLARPALPAARRARPALSGRCSSGRLPGPGAVHARVRLRLAARPALASGPAWPRRGLPRAGAPGVLAVLSASMGGSRDPCPLAVAELAASGGGSSAPFPLALAELAAGVGGSRSPRALALALALALARGWPGRLPAAGAPDPLAELSRCLLVRRIGTGTVLALPVRACVARGVLTGLTGSEPRLVGRAGPVLAGAGRGVIAWLALAWLALAWLAGPAVPVRPERVRAGPGVSRSVPRLGGPLLLRLSGRRPLP
jgi:hypothetical protein